MSLAKEVHDFIQSKLAVPETPKIVSLLDMVMNQRMTPMMRPPSEPAPYNPEAVNEMIPDTGKIQTNMQKNSLMSKYPGLGAK